MPFESEHQVIIYNVDYFHFMIIMLDVIMICLVDTEYMCLSLFIWKKICSGDNGMLLYILLGHAAANIKPKQRKKNITTPEHALIIDLDSLPMENDICTCTLFMIIHANI